MTLFRRHLRAAAARIRSHVAVRRFASWSGRQFRGDPRYELKNVAEGFASRCEDAGDDSGLLERICQAYARTVAHAESAAAPYGPTEWWKEVRESCLGPVMRALQEGDVEVLRGIYGHFFRDRCATGLTGVAYGTVQACLRGPRRDFHRRWYLGDALCRIDYWLSQTGGRFGLADLAGPAAGDPFGVSIDGTLVRPGSEYQHYCARQILRRLGSRPCTVGEIGGGYGGMAYYLLRDGGRLTYVDFDVPESIALASYYLLKAFPSSKFLLYGEGEPTAELLAGSDIVLLPLFEMARIPAGSVNLMFSSHAMSDLSDGAMAAYLEAIARTTRDYLVYCGDSRAAQRLSRLGDGRFRLVEERPTAWNRHRAPKAAEGEYHYRLGRG